MRVQIRVRLGLQRLLPPWLGQPAGRAHTSIRTSGLSSLVRYSPSETLHDHGHISPSQFAQNNELTRAVHISAGPSNSVVIDRQKMYWMAGKWKTSGEGVSLCFPPLTKKQCLNSFTSHHRLWWIPLLLFSLHSRHHGLQGLPRVQRWSDAFCACAGRRSGRGCDDDCVWAGGDEL